MKDNESSESLGSSKRVTWSKGITNVYPSSNGCILTSFNYRHNSTGSYSRGFLNPLSRFLMNLGALLHDFKMTPTDCTALARLASSKPIVKVKRGPFESLRNGQPFLDYLEVIRLMFRCAPR